MSRSNTNGTKTTGFLSGAARLTSLYPNKWISASARRKFVVVFDVGIQPND